MHASFKSADSASWALGLLLISSSFPFLFSSSHSRRLGYRRSAVARRCTSLDCSTDTLDGFVLGFGYTHTCMLYIRTDTFHSLGKRASKRGGEQEKDAFQPHGGRGGL